jgi:predicted DNA-binding transcriptional regulator AlpA
MDTVYDQLRDERYVAQLLHVKVKTLQAWRSRGGGPRFVRVGRLVRYRDEDVAAWIQSRLVVSTSEK